MRPARFLIALALVAGLIALAGPVRRRRRRATASTSRRPGRPSPTVRPGKSSLDAARCRAPRAPRSRSATRPAPGWSSTAALGRREDRNRVFGKIIAAINHAPAKSRIRMMSWNIMSRTAVDALLRAQTRGVKVRVLMDNTNLVDIPNPGLRRLQGDGFKRANQAAGQEGRSFAKTCLASCRGARGAAHSKYYLFSQTGKARNVVMQGSANLTGPRRGQPVERHLHLGRQPQASTTSPAASTTRCGRTTRSPRQFVQSTTGKDLAGLHPAPRPRRSHRGPDPETLLNQVTCTGARGAGTDGRTVIRAAPDVIRNERGMAHRPAAARALDQGCDVASATR